MIPMLPKPAIIARTRTRQVIPSPTSRMPKLVGSDHCGVLRLVLVLVRGAGAGSAGMREGRAALALVMAMGGALDKTRGCVQIQMREVRNRGVPKVGRS